VGIKSVADFAACGRKTVEVFAGLKFVSVSLDLLKVFTDESRCKQILSR